MNRIEAAGGHADGRSTSTVCGSRAGIGIEESTIGSLTACNIGRRMPSGMAQPEGLQSAVSM
jgi:hypothetical protein